MTDLIPRLFSLCSIIIFTIVMIDSRVSHADADSLEENQKCPPYSDDSYACLCKTEKNPEKNIQEKLGSGVCPRYIVHHFEGNSDRILEIYNGVENQKDKFKDKVKDKRSIAISVNMSLVFLTFLTTLFAIIGRINPKGRFLNLPVRLATIPTFVALFTTAITSINAYFKFDEDYEINRIIRSELSTLESNIGQSLLDHVAKRNSTEAQNIESTLSGENGDDLWNEVNAWRTQLDTILRRLDPNKKMVSREN